MSNIPSWLKCENCLWWSFTNEISFFHSTTLDKEYITGCIHLDVAPQLHSCDYRCTKWQCRRCLRTLDDILADWPNIENHTSCFRVGRGKKNKDNVGFLNGEE